LIARRPRNVLPVVLLLLLALPAIARAQISLPSGFVADDVAPGVTFDTPTSIAFMPDGRMLVTEKRGRVWTVKDGVRYPTPLWSRENEVLNEDDRGLLCVTVDPNYATNRYIYLLYTVDPDSNGVDTNDDAFGRLARYQVSAADSNVLIASSRTILLGVNWRNGPASGSPSHTIGSLRWGEDGSLFVSAGDGAQFTTTPDGGGFDPNMFGPTKTDPYEDIGAFRAQYIGSLAGKILRINPATGHGYASNPYADGNLASVRSRVWAYGLRNPFRFTFRPGTGVADTSLGNPGTLYIGEVGWSTWEEMDIATQPGRNFGWPCYEGFHSNTAYQSLTPSHNGCSSTGTADNPAPFTLPVADWNHNNPLLSSPSGIQGNASVGGVFYTRNHYPTTYHNQYFYADYGKDWINVAVVNGADQLQQVIPFATNADGPVDLEVEPVSGDLYYVAIVTGDIFHIRYTGTTVNAPPVPVAAGAPLAGAAPLTVNFSSAGSYDPDGDALQYSWNFGDATGSTSPNPSHLYATPGTFQAVLTLSDGLGGQSSDTVTVDVVAGSGFPVTGVLDGFNRADGPIGGSWVDETAGLIIDANALAQNGPASSTVWNGGVFGPDQEAFIRFDAVTPTAPEHDLLLKVQGLSWATGHIEVHYDAALSHVTIETYDPNDAWVPRGTIESVTFGPGDQFGARAYSNGAVQVYKNGVAIGSTSVAGWAYAALGGHLGLTIVGAYSSRLDDFGGGTVSLDPNTDPVATILSPLDLTFFVTGDTIRLHGQGSDNEDPESALHFHWQMNLHHNNHVHPGSFVSDSINDFYIAANHDDGTGIYDEIQLQVTDTGFRTDTARVNIYPEINLVPAALVTLPTTPGTTAPAQYQFWILNKGRMPAPYSRWRLVADGALLAEGDTLVDALDSVIVRVTLPPTLAAGTHTLRIALDTLATVVETIETDNAMTVALAVVTGSGPDQTPPVFMAGPSVDAASDAASFQWTTNEVAIGTIYVGRTPAAGDTVLHVNTPATHQVVQLQPLLAATLYYYLVSAVDLSGNPVATALDSFTTAANVTGTPRDGGGTLALSAGMPNPSAGAVALGLSLPRSSRVAFAVYDLSGREVWRATPREYGAGRWLLNWPGETREGARVRTGIYLARVAVDGIVFTRRLAMLR
jgi:glucose/arabinose dehydrogenase